MCDFTNNLTNEQTNRDITPETEVIISYEEFFLIPPLSLITLLIQ